MSSEVVEKRIEEISTIVEELGHIIPRDGWTDYAIGLLARLQKLAIILDDEDTRADGMFEAFKNAWITTKGGDHIHIGDDGDPDMGNPHVLDYIRDRVEEDETRKKYPRKRDMVCESKVSFDKPGSVTTDKLGRTINHFNHDEDVMKVTRSVMIKGENGVEFKMYPGEIKHLTVFAAKDIGWGLEKAKYLAKQVGGPEDSWKHVKGIGKVVNAYGQEFEADIHWFESPEHGQVGWKIKQFREDMDESEVYWEEK